MSAEQEASRPLSMLLRLSEELPLVAHGPVQLRRLTFVSDGEDVVVGCADIDVYGVFPPQGAELLARLGDGMSPRDAAQWFEVTYGERVDMDDFLDTLDELGFMTPEGPAPGGDATRAPRLVLTSRASAVAGRFAFSPVAWAAYVALIAAAGAVLTITPGARPHPQAVFFTNSLLAMQAVLLLGEMAGMAWHEAFHALAGRRMGLPVTVRVSRRLYFVVFESQISGVLGVPKNRRYLPLLAGMLADVLALCAFVVLAAATHGPVARALVALGYFTMLRLGWQLLLFLRTDLYFVLCALLRCHDLHGAARARMRSWGRRLGLRVSVPDVSAWTPRDQAVARWYAPLVTVGSVALVLLAVYGLVPILIELAWRARDGLVGDGVGLRFFDAVAATLIVAGPQVVIAVLVVSRLLRRAVGAVATSSAPASGA